MFENIQYSEYSICLRIFNNSEQNALQWNYKPSGFLKWNYKPPGKIYKSLPG